MKNSAPTSLKHHFLIAMPHMDDPNFAQTVTYLVEHNEQGAMGLVMLAWMLNMYRNAKANIAVVLVSAVLLGGGIVLDRSQATVNDSDFMRAMIPHHSLAITRSERAGIEDVRVCQLAVEISEAQRREIFEMDWLIQDIQDNGIAATPEQAQARSVPDYEEPAERQCPTG